jgi:hypothetical protein
VGHQLEARTPAAPRNAWELALHGVEAPRLVGVLVVEMGAMVAVHRSRDGQPFVVERIDVHDNPLAQCIHVCARTSACAFLNRGHDSAPSGSVKLVAPFRALAMPAPVAGQRTLPADALLLLCSLRGRRLFDPWRARTARASQ